MRRIYTFARQVLIWLGPAGKVSGMCVQNLLDGHIGLNEPTRPRFMEPLDGPVGLNEPIRFMQELKCLMERDWFTRVWVHLLYIKYLSHEGYAD